MPNEGASRRSGDLNGLATLGLGEDDAGQRFVRDVGSGHLLGRGNRHQSTAKVRSRWSTVLGACLLFEEMARSLLFYMQVYCQSLLKGSLT